MTMARPIPIAPPPPRRGKTAFALLSVALLSSLPFVVKRGCSFHADFDPVAARTNSSGAITNR